MVGATLVRLLSEALGQTAVPAQPLSVSGACPDCKDISQ